MGKALWSVIGIVVVLAGAACRDGGGGDGDGDVDSYVDSDVDSDADVDGDADGDAGRDVGLDGQEGGPPPCPADPPENEAGCDALGLSCAWQRCETDAGVVSFAECRDSGWLVSTEPCEGASCAGEIGCATDELCVHRVGGAEMLECQPNPCEEGPIEPACACELCGGALCTVYRLDVTCNTCPSGLCP